MGKIYGIIAILCGILSFSGLILVIVPLFHIFIMVGWFLLPGVAIISGLIGTYYDDPKSIAWAGFILGSLGLVTLPLFYMMLGFSLFA